MKTQKITLLVVLMVLSAALAFAGDFVSLGFTNMATQTLTLTSTTTATILGTIPTSCNKVEVIVTGGAVNYGPASVTTHTCWPYIASGSQKEFDEIGIRNPRIYFIQRGVASPAVTMTVGIVAK